MKSSKKLSKKRSKKRSKKFSKKLNKKRSNYKGGKRISRRNKIKKGGVNENPLNKIDFLKQLFDDYSENKCNLKVKGKAICSNGPWDNNDLLSNIDITEALKAFENMFDFFVSHEFTMDDWDKNNETLVYKLATDTPSVCKLIKNGKKCVGFIMNTDNWSGPGKHWTAMFIDMRQDGNWSIEFFNSSGNPPSPRIKKLMDCVKTNISMCNQCMGPVKTMDVVKKEHQKTDTECGVYCLAYIYRRCKNLSTDLFSNTIYDRWIDDKDDKKILKEWRYCIMGPR